MVTNLMILIRIDCKNSHLRLIIKFEIQRHNWDAELIIRMKQNHGKELFCIGANLHIL